MDTHGGAQQVPRRLIMHFTHVMNLPGILASGCIQADSLVGRSSALRIEVWWYFGNV